VCCDGILGDGPAALRAKEIDIEAALFILIAKDEPIIEAEIIQEQGARSGAYCSDGGHAGDTGIHAC
jgi:hypothetical protein